MRFALLVLVAAGAGAAGMTVMQTLVPGNASMFEAVRALGGNVASFRLPDINPRKAYDDVKKQITSGETAGMPKFDTKPIPHLQFTGPLIKPSQYKSDPSIQRAISSGITARIGQDIRRAQDIAAYGRNPTAWHGVPPR
jgi:hypothetical protein